MADIVIRGMEMPRFCWECPLKESMYDVGFICLPRKEPIKVNLNKGRDDACPLVPLPEKHGRLIDADAFLRDNAEFADLDFCHPKYDTTLRELVADAPTILEAEGGSEDG